MADFEEKFGGGMDFYAKYTMLIFLMHTLFCSIAEIRTAENGHYERRGTYCVGSGQ